MNPIAPLPEWMKDVAGGLQRGESREIAPGVLG